MKKMLIMLSFLILYVFVSAELDPRYHTNEEIYEEIIQLQEDNPDIVMVEQIGTTLGADPYREPMPIWGVKISDNVITDEDEPAVMYAGQCHAEEVLGVEITMWMLHDIVEHRYQSPYNIWISELEMWFVPTYNPEGLEVVMDGRDESFRKNQRDNNENGVFDYIPGPGNDIDGVDLNRNYGFNWCHGDTLYCPDGEETYDYYRGPAPFSEGGTQAIRYLAEQQHFIYSINWHSSRTGYFSEQIMYSFKFGDVKPAVDLDFNEYIGNTVAYLIEDETGTGYYEPSPSMGRNAKAHDWFYQTYGTTQLQAECGTSNLQPGADLVDDTCQRCSIGAYWLLNRAIGYETSAAMLTGHVTDAVTGEPLVAEIIIEEKTASYLRPRKTDELYGRYWRQLLQGTYTLRVRKKGYEEYVLPGIVVNNSLWTVRDVELVPLDEVNITGTLKLNDSLVPGTIIIRGYEDEVIDTSDGNFTVDAFAGEQNWIVTSEDCVPKIYNVNLAGGDYNIDLIMHPENGVFHEEWSNGTDDWIVEGPWEIRTADNGNHYIDDSPSGFYDVATSVSLTTADQIMISGDRDDAILSFKHAYYTEHDYDVCTVEASINGTDWQILAEYSGLKVDWDNWSGYNDVWHFEAISLSDYLSQNIYLRFRLTSDDTMVDPGWKIDEIKINTAGTGIPGTDMPDVTRLKGNYPNPFNPSTKITFSVAAQDAEDAEIGIYNIKGQKVKSFSLSSHPELVDGSVEWNGKDNSGNNVSSGLYFYKLDAGKYSSTKKMILLK